MRILIVEDDYFIALMLEEALQEAGHVVVGWAPNSETASILAARHRPDVATMDLQLERGDDGEQVACFLFERFGIRCLFASGSITQAVIDRCAPLNPVGFVRKPFREEEVVRMLSTVSTAPEGGPTVELTQ